jgi:hypothetical protein
MYCGRGEEKMHKVALNAAVQMWRSESILQLMSRIERTVSSYHQE